MPLMDIQLYGDFSGGGSFRAEDRKFVASVKARQKIRDALVGVPAPIQLHFVNLPHCFDDRTLRRLIRSADPDSAEQRIGYMSAEKFRHVYNVRIKAARNCLNVVYIENEGENRLPLTPWIIAHRLYHALALAAQDRPDAVYRRLSDNLTRLLVAAAEIYRCSDHAGDGDGLCLANLFGAEPAQRETSLAVLKFLAEQIFDTKVCRRNRLNNHLEAIAEVFAQWCIAGDIHTRMLSRRMIWSEQPFEAAAEDASGIHQKVFRLGRQLKEAFAVEVRKALRADERLLVF